MWTNPDQDVFGGRRTVWRRHPISPSTTRVWESNSGHQSWQQALLPAGLSILEKTTLGKLGRSESSRANRPVVAGCALCLWGLIAQVHNFHPPSTTPSLSPFFWAGTKDTEQLGQNSTIALHPYTMTCFFICKWIFASSLVETREEGTETK